MDDKIVKILSTKLDAIIKLMVFGITGRKNQMEQIRLLAEAGFEPKQIADTLGTTPNTVRVTLFKLRSDKANLKRRSSRIRVKEVEL